MNNITSPRRRFIKSSAFGIIGITALGNSIAQDMAAIPTNIINGEPLFYRYPSMNDTMVSSIVGA